MRVLGSCRGEQPQGTTASCSRGHMHVYPARLEPCSSSAAGKASVNVKTHAPIAFGYCQTASFWSSRQTTSAAGHPRVAFWRMVHGSKLEHINPTAADTADIPLFVLLVLFAVSRYGQDHILVEIQFPDDYPTQPFFMRVVSPR